MTLKSLQVMRGATNSSTEDYYIVVCLEQLLNEILGHIACACYCDCLGHLVSSVVFGLWSCLLSVNCVFGSASDMHIYTPYGSPQASSISQVWAQLVADSLESEFFNFALNAENFKELRKNWIEFINLPFNNSLKVNVERAYVLCEIQSLSLYLMMCSWWKQTLRPWKFFLLFNISI